MCPLCSGVGCPICAGGFDEVIRRTRGFAEPQEEHARVTAWSVVYNSADDTIIITLDGDTLDAEQAAAVVEALSAALDRSVEIATAIDVPSRERRSSPRR